MFLGWYWSHVGRYSTDAWGWLGDLAPFSLTSAAMGAGGIMAVFAAARLLANLPRVWHFLRSLKAREIFPSLRRALSRRKALAAVLALAALLTGDAGLRCWARFEQPGLPGALGAPERVRPEQVDALVEAALRRVEMDFRAEDYLALDEGLALAEANRIYPRLYAALGLPGGRRVRRVKPMTGPWRVLSASYGAYAGYGAVPFEEAAIPPQRLYPMNTLHRSVSLFHEVAHSYTFRESDADTLAYLAMSRSRLPVLRALSALALVYNSHWYPGCRDALRPRVPRAVLEDRRAQGALAREAALRDYWVVWLSGALEKKGVQLKPEKYGGGPVFREDDPYFRGIWAAEQNAFMGDSLLWFLNGDELPNGKN